MIEKFNEIIEEWKPHCGKLNYRCYLCNRGWWHIDKCPGKWLFHCAQNGDKDVPTYDDQMNMISAIVEVERRNDIWRLKQTTNVKSSPQKGKFVSYLKSFIKEEEKKNEQIKIV